MSEGLMNLVPPIRRARGYRLYAMDNRRILDLWQWGGRAVLGHTAPRLLTTLKNSASRGLFAPVPHPSLRRLERTLEGRFPGRTIRVFADEASADSFLGAVGFVDLRLRDFHDPALAGLDGTVPAPRGGLWRPWVEDRDLDGLEVLSPIIPLPWPSCPVALAFRRRDGDSLPPSDLIPPLIAVAAVQGLCDLALLLGQGASPSYPKTMDAVAAGGWKLRGIYLACPASWTDIQYGRFFAHALAEGILVPPLRGAPLILPRDSSPGEDSAIARVLRFEP